MECFNVAGGQGQSTEEALAQLVRKQSEELERLRSRVESLEAGRMGQVSASRKISESESISALDEESSTRRGFMKNLGLVALGSGVATALTPNTAAAVDGGSFTGAQTSFTNSSSDATTAGVKGAFTNANGTGVRGIANSGSSAAGVEGVSTSGYGVYGNSSSGYSVYAGGNGRIGLAAHVSTGPPLSGGYALGDIFRDGDGAAWYCIGSNVDSAGNTLSTGPATFRKLSGPGTAGQWHPLQTPTIVYDNRFFNNAPGTGGKHGTGETRTVDLRYGNKFPAAATAVSATVLVWATESSAFFSMFPGDGTFNGVGQLYWTAAGQLLTFSTMTRVQSTNGTSLVKIVTGAPCNITIEVNGYFL